MKKFWHSVTWLILVVGFIVMLGSIRPLQPGLTWPVEPAMLGLGVSLLTFAMAFWDKARKWQ